MSGAERWLMLAVLFLARTVIAFQFQSIAALGPDLVIGLHIDYARLGFLIGLYMLPGVAIAVPGGMLGQRFGDKRTVVFGLALMALGGALCAIAGSYGIALAGRLISGIGAVLVYVLLAKMATDWFAGRAIRTALALLVMSWPLGMGVALVVEPRIAAAYSPSVALQVATAASGVIAVLTVLVYRTPGGAAAAAAPSLRLGLSLREFGLVSLAGLIWALFNSGYNLLVGFAPAMLVAGGASAADAGLATSLATWTTTVSVLLGGVVADRIGSPTALMVGSFALLAAAMLLAPVTAPLTLIALVGLIGGLPAGAILALAAEVLRPASRGPGMGVYFTWYYVAMALLPPLAGAMRDMTGLPGAPVAFGGAIELLALAVLGLLRLLQARYGPAVAGAPQPRLGRQG
jgi:MFS family permease